jgi:RNA polymerase sigma-70 factor (ECF subfamily)
VPRGLEVDDVIQEGYAIFSSLADVSRIGNPRAYFYQVVRSLISEHFRRAGVETSGAGLDVESVTEPQEGLTPERILSGRQELDRLYRAITRLPEPARTIFVMRKIDNLPQKVIAERLRVSENTVENHVARGLRVILLQFAREDGSSQPNSMTPIKKRKAGLSDA